MIRARKLWAATAIALTAAALAGSPASAVNPHIKREVFYYSDPNHTNLVGQSIMFCEGGSQTWGTRTEFVDAYTYICP